MFTRRPLEGLRIVLSLSESEDLSARGFTSAGMNRLTVGIARALLDQGCKLAFGHDWRQQGVMEAICSFAIDSQETGASESGDPLILNLLPWPARSQVPAGIHDRLPSILEIRQAGLPEDIRTAAHFGAAPEENPEIARYYRARSLTHLRHELVRVSSGCICLGGRATGYQGRYPGILEEAFFALRARQPVYLLGLLGGLAESLGRALLDGLEIPADFGAAPFQAVQEGGRPLETLYRAHRSLPQAVESSEDLEIDLSSLSSQLRELGPEGLSELNHLSLDENRRLLETTSAEEAIQLVLRGLGRVKKGRT